MVNYKSKFTFKCNACQSERVVIINEVRSEKDVEGSINTWGYITVTCKNCKNSIVIYEP